LNPLIDDQGISKPIYANICFGDKVATCHMFLPVAYVMGNGLSSDKMCGHFLEYSNVNRAGFVISLLWMLTTLNVIVKEFQGIGCNAKATKP